MSYQVFIERTSSPEPEAAESLASAIAARYKIPAAGILGRLKKGRFRVKANLDRAAADKFKEYLESLGALCSIVDESGQIVERSAALRPSAPEPATPSPSSTEESGEFGLTLQTPPPPEMPSEIPAASPKEDFESGLSAAKGAQPQDLGVLGSGSGFQLASLDDTGPQKPGAPSSEPVAVTHGDAFLPPGMGEEDKPVVLDVDMDMPTPPPRAPSQEFAAADSGSMNAAESSSRMRAASSNRMLAMDDDDEEAEYATAPRENFLLRVATNPRLRFGLGVALAIAIGFLPAHLLAAAREDSKYAEVRKDLRAEYAAADTEDRWNALDEARATASELLAARQRNVLITSLVIWAAVSGGLAFVWFRKIRWDELAERAS